MRFVIGDNKFKSRFPICWKGSLEKLASHYCEFLVENYKKTDPLKNFKINHEFENKDLDAFEALKYFGMLLRDLAGWAIDHQAGKVILDAPLFVPMFPTGMSEASVAELEKLEEIVQSHEPEAKGATITREYLLDGKSSLTDEQQRQFLAILLNALNAGLQLPLLENLVAALNSLNVGETSPLLQPKKRTANWTRAHYLLQALEYVEFWRAFTSSKSPKYYKHVKMAFEGNDDRDDPNDDDQIRSARRYRSQAVKYLGLVSVESRLTMARNDGINLRNGQMDKWFEETIKRQYSRECLKQIGQIFRRRQVKRTN